MRAIGLVLTLLLLGASVGCGDGADDQANPRGLVYAYGPDGRPIYHREPDNRWWGRPGADPRPIQPYPGMQPWNPYARRPFSFFEPETWFQQELPPQPPPPESTRPWFYRNDASAQQRVNLGGF